MKSIRMILLIIPFSFFACTNQKDENENCVYDSGFSICQDTISVNIKGDMTHALKYHDKFFMLFEQRVLRYGSHGRRWLYIFSNGKIERIVDIPKKMNAGYWDFFVKNDSIIIKQYMGEPHFLFNTQDYTWEEIDKVDDLIFEDEKFHVYSLNFGEWGGKTWFKDKKTGIEYLIEATTPLINRIDTTYYLTNSFSVLKIENPLQLNICNDDVTYENIRTEGRYYSWYGQPIGFDVVYKDTIFNYLDYSYKSHIVSSFTWQDELLHIYETDTATYIAKIENNEIKAIQEIGKELSFYNWHYSYRCRNLNGKSVLLKFNTKDEYSFGLMDIVDNRIRLCYFVNSAELEPKSIGAKKANSIFVNRLNHIMADLGKLRLTEIDSLEQKWGTFDITPTYKIGISESYYPNPNKYELDTCKSYLVQEDSIISNAITYYSTKATDLVRVISIDWEKTDVRNRNYEELTKEIFQRKYVFLENYLTQEFGESTENIRKKDKYPAKIWKTKNGFTIKLENTSNYNFIRMIIYKE